MQRLALGCLPCRRGMKANMPYENRKHPLVSTVVMQVTALYAMPPWDCLW